MSERDDIATLPRELSPHGQGHEPDRDVMDDEDRLRPDFVDRTQ